MQYRPLDLFVPHTMLCFFRVATTGLSRYIFLSIFCTRRSCRLLLLIMSTLYACIVTLPDIRCLRRALRARCRMDNISPYVLLNIDDEVIAKTKTKKKVKQHHP